MRYDAPIFFIVHKAIDAFFVCVSLTPRFVFHLQKKRESKTQQTATVMGSACVRVCGWWKGRGEWISWTRGVVVIVVVCLVKFLCTKTKRKVGSMRIPKGRLPPWEGPNTSESALVALLGGEGRWGGETRASQFTFMVTRTDNGNVQIQRSWSFTLRFRESYSQSDRINK